MKAPFVRTTLAFAMCVVFSYPAGAQNLATSHQEQAKLLLDQIEQHLNRVRNYRCQKVTALRAIPGINHGRPRYRHEWLAADRQGRGSLRSTEDGQVTTLIWDGQNSIEHRTELDPNGTTTHQVSIVKGAQFPTQWHNEPWDYMGSNLANFLTQALQGNGTVRVYLSNDGRYRVDIRNIKDATYTFILDPQKAYVPVYRRIYSNGKIQTLETITFKQADTNIWFPVEVQSEIDEDGERLASPTLKCRFTEVSVNNWDFEQTFRHIWPEGTRVYDRVHGQTYVVGEEDKIEALEPPTTTTPEPQDANTPTPQPQKPSWQAVFEATYQLQNNQALKCITPPFPPERAQYLATLDSRSASRTMENRLYRFAWSDGLKDSKPIASNRFLQLSTVLENVVGLSPYEYEGGAYLLNLPLTGDWIVRQNASTEQLLANLGQIVKDQRQRSLGFVKQQADAIVIRASGVYRFQALPPVQTGGQVHVYAGNLTALRADPVSDSDCGAVREFLDYVAHSVGMPIFDGTRSSLVNMCWVSHNSAQLQSYRNTPSVYNAQLAALLSNLSNQTGLSFTIELGKIDRWQVVPQQATTARSN